MNLFFVQYQSDHVHPDPLSHLDFFCFLFILYTTKELYDFNSYHVLTIKLFFIKVKIRKVTTLCHKVCPKN